MRKKEKGFIDRLLEAVKDGCERALKIRAKKRSSSKRRKPKRAIPRKQSGSSKRQRAYTSGKKRSSKTEKSKRVSVKTASGGRSRKGGAGSSKRKSGSSVKRSSARKVRVGEVTNYFSNIRVAVVRIDSSGLKIGDKLVMLSSDDEIKMRLGSMQINRVPVREAGPGKSVGILTTSPVKEGYLVYKII